MRLWTNFPGGRDGLEKLDKFVTDKEIYLTKICLVFWCSDTLPSCYPVREFWAQLAASPASTPKLFLRFLGLEVRTRGLARSFLVWLIWMLQKMEVIRKIWIQKKVRKISLWSLRWRFNNISFVDVADSNVVSNGTASPKESEDVVMEEDTARPEGTIRFVVNNFSKLKETVLSDPIYVRNLPW